MDFFPDMRVRNVIDSEKMDLPEADLDTLHRTIRQFRLINMLFSASRRLLREHVFSIMERDRQRQYTLLDVGAGGCDIAVWGACEARKRNLSLRITALDNDARISPVALQEIQPYPEITFQIGNALDLGNMEKFDFIFSNHFLHHLRWDEISLFLQQALAHTRLALVMNDLKRCRWSYLASSLLLPLLGRNSFICCDGKLSIRRGFTSSELAQLLDSEVSANQFRVKEVFPARVVITSEGVPFFSSLP